MDASSQQSVVFGIIGEVTTVPAESLLPSSRLRDVGIDSIAEFEVRLLIREKLGKEISEGEFAALETIADLVGCCEGAKG